MPLLLCRAGLCLSELEYLTPPPHPSHLLAPPLCAEEVSFEPGAICVKFRHNMCRFFFCFFLLRWWDRYVCARRTDWYFLLEMFSIATSRNKHGQLLPNRVAVGGVHVRESETCISSTRCAVSGHLFVGMTVLDPRLKIMIYIQGQYSNIEFSPVSSFLCLCSFAMHAKPASSE